MVSYLLASISFTNLGESPSSVKQSAITCFGMAYLLISFWGPFLVPIPMPNNDDQQSPDCVQTGATFPNMFWSLKLATQNGELHAYVVNCYMLTTEGKFWSPASSTKVVPETGPETHPSRTQIQGPNNTQSSSPKRGTPMSSFIRKSFVNDLLC